MLNGIFCYYEGGGFKVENLRPFITQRRGDIIIKQRVITKERALRIAEIIQALGGEATLTQIYTSYDYLYPEHKHYYRKWKEQIRTSIYEHSSDTDIFKGKLNLFFTLGKGSGKWGLRDYKDQGPRAPYLTEE